MPIIAKNISAAVYGKELFKDASFIVQKGSRAALIGPNGCGKTTLFNILLGREEVDDGSLIIDKETIGYVPQEFEFPHNTSIQNHLLTIVEQNEQWKVEKIFASLQMENVNIHTVIDTLSEGQKLKVALASVLVTDPTILLIDEPTNHLDIEGVEWLEDYLNNQYTGGLLMISHDRSFLDNTVKVIYEIDELGVHTFHGNYTDYKENKEGWIDRRNADYRAQERKRRQLIRVLESSRKIKDGKKRGAAVQAAKKRIEREITAHEITEYTPYSINNLDIEGSTHTGKIMVKIDHLHKSYDNREVLADLNYEMRGTSRAWIKGINGAGKTTLLNILTENLQPTKGSAYIGDNVKWGYFKQNQQHLPMETTLHDYLIEQGLPESKTYAFLKKYSYPMAYMDTKLGNMSPGERARMSFALFTQNEYNLLILDEPTNHLDIWTKESIEKSLQEYKGALILVSHDRYFVQNVGIDTIIDLSA